MRRSASRSEIDAFGQHQRVVQNPREQRVQERRGEPRVERGGQLPLLDRVEKTALDPLDALAHIVLVPLAHRTHLLDELALEKEDVENPPALLVERDVAHAPDKDVAHPAERVGFLRIERGLHEFVERQQAAIEHLGEKIALVGEVPVDRAARDAGLLRDVGKRRARYTLLEKYALGGVENPDCASRALLPWFV